MREFETGAKRDGDDGKVDYEGHLSPLVIQAYGRYMHRHRKMADGSMRDSDNWQRGMPLDSYLKSGWRHLFDWWCLHRGMTARETMEDALCGVMFNAMGYLHEYLKGDVNYRVGDLVQKTRGYKFPGVVVSVFEKLDGEVRYVVEASNRDFPGILHIFRGDQLERRSVQPVMHAGVAA